MKLGAAARCAWWNLALVCVEQGAAVVCGTTIIIMSYVPFVCVVVIE